MDSKKLEMAKTLMADPNNSIAEVCQTLQISLATLYRSIGKGFVKQAFADQRARISNNLETLE